jgi:flagellar M-ring protein FliF
VEQVFERLKQDGSRRLAAFVLVGAALIAATAVIALSFSKPQMDLLFTELNESDAAQIVSTLESLDVPVRLSSDGRTIYAPRDRIARIRMTLAEKGLPSGGTVGYELFDKNESLGLTSFMQNVSRVRALEGELSRTIQTLTSIEGARVHLVLASRDPFSREVADPSASVVVRMRGAMTLDASQAASIRHLVASAVPQLEPGGVSVLDARHGTVFAEQNGALAGAASVDGLRQGIEARLAQAVESVLTPTVGPGNVRVSIAADLRTDREVQKEERFDPDETVLRSRQTVDETENARENADEDPVTVEQNLPEADIDSDVLAKSTSEIERTEQTENYEVSSVRRERIIEPGEIERLSVSVIVDNVRTVGPDGTLQSVPRSPEELAKLANLVRSAVGYDATRGDVVTIENLPFADLDTLLPGQDGQPLTRALTENVDTIARAAMFLAFGLAVIFGVVRPAMNRLLPSANDNDTIETTPLEPVPGTEGAEAGEGKPALDANGEPQRLSLPKRSMDDTLNDMLELRDVDGKVRASSVRKLGQISDQYPEEVVAILRSWIYEDAA